MGYSLFFRDEIFYFVEKFEDIAQHNLPAQSLDPLPMNPTLFGYFEDSEVRFENTAEDFGRILGEVMMGEYGVPLSLTDDGVRMLLMPTRVVIEEDTVRLTYQYAESGGVSVLAVSLTGGIALLRTADDRYPVVSFEKADGVATVDTTLSGGNN